MYQSREQRFTLINLALLDLHNIVLHRAKAFPIESNRVTAELDKSDHFMRTCSTAIKISSWNFVKETRYYAPKALISLDGWRKQINGLSRIIFKTKENRCNRNAWCNRNTWLQTFTPFNNCMYVLKSDSIKKGYDTITPSRSHLLIKLQTPSIEVELLPEVQHHLYR